MSLLFGDSGESKNLSVKTDPFAIALVEFFWCLRKKKHAQPTVIQNDRQ